MAVSRTRWGWAAAAACALALWSAADSGGFRRYLYLRQQIAGLKERNQQLEEQNQALQREVAALQSDGKMQERVVREELGFVKPGEAIIDLE